MKTASISRILRTILLLIVGYFMIGVGVYGCRKEEPVSEDTTPIESVEPVREDISPKRSVSLEGNLENTKIAFVSIREGNPEIYVMNADGSEQKRLTNNLTADVFPSWSPDGKRIVFTSEQQGKNIEPISLLDRNCDIYVMNVDGRNLKRLTNNPALDLFTSWSPDGTKIAFASYRKKTFGIYVMNPDGSGQKGLTNHANLSYPSWSPDGKKITFQSIRDRNDEIYIMNADGSEQRNLTNNPASDLNHSWAPDGKKITFMSDRDGNREIYVMNADGSEQNNLTNNPAADEYPSWSPFLSSENKTMEEK